MDLSAYGIDNYTFIIGSVLGGAIIGWLLQKFLTRKRETALTSEVGKANKSDKKRTGNKKDDQFVGKMNVSAVRKNRVIFSPEVDKNEMKNSPRKDEAEPKSDDFEETDEEQMPQFNDRKIKEPKNTEEELSDSDKINTTIGKLHGKLATAQLKAKTRQIAAEMSAEEKEYEARMKDNQMASILKLMMQNQEKFGMSSDDIKEQMNLYNF